MLISGSDFLFTKRYKMIFLSTFHCFFIPIVAIIVLTTTTTIIGIKLFIVVIVVETSATATIGMKQYIFW